MNETMESIARDGKELLDSLPAARETVRETLDILQTQLRAVDARTRAFIRERPLIALAAAVAVGFGLRRLLASGK